ncbi:hypothetical protein Q7P37_001089 [Cladosporium fusiforme]
MEDLPIDYTDHNLPLVLLSGLDNEYHTGTAGNGTPRQESGTRLAIQSAACQGDRAGHLLQQFIKRDGSISAWNAGTLPGPVGSMKFHMQAIGRSYTLPPRKAAPIAQAASVEDTVNRPRSPSKSAELHSPLSPLSPGSPIFPDGVFTPLWLAKHQRQIPAVFVAFFDIKAGDGAASDDQIKADINAVRAAISRSGFKTRFAAVLLSDKSILHAAELEERLASIRRVTNLDSKTSLFFMPPVSSQGEMSGFVHGVLSALQPSIVEYYRDLTKHARRKKARGTIPTSGSTPASQSLSNVGWNARYETKQGVFAEFRQEMDVAERHYSQAIEDLFNPEGIFETTPSWSPRWNEARLLADALALRVLRCQLWTGSSTGASQSWSNYRLRMKDLVDRRGKGSQTYSWDAWESRWAKIMAELTRRADLPALQIQTKQPPEGALEPSNLLTHALAEKAFSTVDRLPPFSLLHHAGYWLRLALNGTRARWQHAQTIPAEDRLSPDGSPASAVAKRSGAYDTYLVPPPHKEYPDQEKSGVDHVTLIMQLSNHAVREFADRKQTRMGEQIKLDAGRDLVKAGHFDEALDQLVSLWKDCTWRNDGWHALYDELLHELHQCAKETGSPELMLTTTWELLGAASSTQRNEVSEIARCLDALPTPADTISVQCKDRERVSPVSVHFAFANKQGFVGEPLRCQLTLTSNAHASTSPIVMSKVELLVDTSKKIEIVHDGDEPAERVTELSLKASNEVIESDTNLALQPQQTRVFNFTLTFREAQAVTLQETAISLVTEKFSLTHSFKDDLLLQTSEWQSELDGELVPSPLYREESTTVEVLPKPPKIQVLLHGLHQQFYVGEEVNIQVELVNEEVDIVKGSIKQGVIAQDDIVLPSNWALSSEATKQDSTLEAASQQDINDLQPSARTTLDLIIDAPMEPVPHTLTIDVDYSLVSEPGTPLKKTIVVELNYVALFEAKFNFGPLVHPDPWPSYFDPAQLSSQEHQPSGIPSRWRLGSQITSVAFDEVTVKGADIVVDRVTNEADFQVLESGEQEDKVLSSDAKLDRNFQVLMQKLSLDDRRPTILELSLAISWSRGPGATLCTTKVPVPRLNIPSSEPRVLCAAQVAQSDTADMTLQYHLENPSTHFLTFAVTMEANDDFAFSGPKFRTLSLAPFSRHELTFNLLMHGNREETRSGDGQGRWIWPVLQVVDSYYQKTLRVQAGGPGVRIDTQRGLGVWVPATKI